MSSAQPNPASPNGLPSTDPSHPCIQEVWIAGQPHLVLTCPEGTLTLNLAHARLLRSHQAYLDAFMATHDPAAPAPPPPIRSVPRLPRAPRRQGSRAHEDYGISRIDQPHKANHGWYVRITRKGRTTQKFFSDGRYAGRESALEAARRHRDAIVASFAGEGNPDAAQG